MASNNQLNVDDSPAWGSRSVDCFEKLEQIGEGTYGQVYRAKEKKTGEVVALKKIRMDNEKEGFPITAIREIKILKKLHHENVVDLKEIVTSPGREGDEQGNRDGNKYKGSIYMVFEYMDHDLTGLADRPGLRFTIPQIKCYMKQLLTGLHYCHVNQVLHRDIKGSNLLIDNEGNLKLADFGLARSFSSDVNANLTNRVITLWYRPPELLLGATKYGPAVDMWSVGCIFAELLYGKPILPGKNEPEQINKIFELCGSPDELNWPGVSKIPWYNKFKPARQMKKRIRELFRHFDRHALDLLEKMLVLDPSKGISAKDALDAKFKSYNEFQLHDNKLYAIETLVISLHLNLGFAQRISAKDALDAEYFWTDPLPCDPKSLPMYESSHEFQTKRRRQQQHQNDETTKRPKMQHTRLPPIQQQPHSQQQWNNNSQPPPFPSHQQYGKPRGPPNRHLPGGSTAGGVYYQDRGGQSSTFNSGQYPPQVRPPYPSSTAPRGPAAGYGAPNYSQNGQYGASGGRGSNPLGGRNQQYSTWQQ